MAIIKLKDFQFEFPEDIIKRTHIKKNQELIIETTPDNIVQIKPIGENHSDAQLMDFLSNPDDMGKILFNDRNDIYDDID
jgi:hypothetical protein